MADEVAGVLNNVNRQIVSTLAGLKVATKPYILKTRTDILVNSSGFLDYFGKYDKNPPCFFRNRLLICNYYTRNPRIMNICFHPSDWFLFGNSEDVRMYFEGIPLQDEEAASWFKTHHKNQTLFTNYLSRFTPEQYIFVNFARRFCEVDIDCYYDFNHKLMRQTEEFFAKCFVVLDYQTQLDICFTKYHPNRYLEKHTLVSHQQWYTMYQHYCHIKTKLLRWQVYCFSKWLYCFRFTARRVIVNFLTTVGLKEIVKSILQSASINFEKSQNDKN